MTGSYPKAEVLPGPERRRSWSTAEKLSIVQETYEADVTVSLVARRHRVAPNPFFRWCRQAAQGALVATRAQEDVVAASEYRAHQAQVPELHRLPGKRRWKPRSWRRRSRSPRAKKALLRSLSWPKDASR